MARWQQHARTVAALVAVGGAVSVWWLMGERQARPAAPSLEPLEPRAAVETRGGDVVQLKGAREDVRVEFDRNVTYQDGQTKLIGVKAVIDNRAGRSFVITGREGQVGANQASIELVGDVTISSSDGLSARAERATYTEAEGIVRAPGPVEFTRGRLSGRGIGFTYDRQRDTLWLLDQAVVAIAPEHGAGALEVQAGAAGVARTDRYLRFEGGMQLTRDGQDIAADEATVTLLADRDEPDLIELRGHARVGGTGLGALQALEGRDINLDYGADGRTLERATLASQAAVALGARGGPATQRLSADWIDVTLASDGAVTALAAREGVQVTLAAAGEQPTRAIRAREVTGSGAAGQGLTRMRFTENVEFREGGGRGAAPRIARARSLDLGLGAGTGAVEAATFSGGVRFTDGGLTAESAEARYDLVAGTLALGGREGQARPRVRDERSQVDADSIDLTLSPRRMTAEGSVSTVLAGGKGVRPDALLRADGAVNVVADRVEFDEAEGRGVYRGNARLWQGDTSIKGDEITLDDRRGDLRAAGGVVTVFALADGQPTTGRGGAFSYEDAERRAVYTTSAQLSGPAGDLRGDRIELQLAKASSALARLEARTGVTVKIDTRTATGGRLTYFPEDERYVLEGSPVRLVEACRETAGRTLTFFKSSARLIVDGNEETRTESKGGGKCPEPPRFE
ncbi:MAG: LptA/OstA family protein [Acidobacteriota bacterium]